MADLHKSNARFFKEALSNASFFIDKNPHYSGEYCVCILHCNNEIKFCVDIVEAEIMAIKLDNHGNLKAPNNATLT